MSSEPSNEPPPFPPFPPKAAKMWMTSKAIIEEIDLFTEKYRKDPTVVKSGAEVDDSDTSSPLLLKGREPFPTEGRMDKFSLEYQKMIDTSEDDPRACARARIPAPARVPFAYLDDGNGGNAGLGLAASPSTVGVSIGTDSPLFDRESETSLANAAACLLLLAGASSNPDSDADDVTVTIPSSVSHHDHDVSTSTCTAAKFKIKGPSFRTSCGGDAFARNDNDKKGRLVDSKDKVVAHSSRDDNQVIASPASPPDHELDFELDFELDSNLKRTNETKDADADADEIVNPSDRIGEAFAQLNMDDNAITSTDSPPDHELDFDLDSNLEENEPPEIIDLTGDSDDDELVEGFKENRVYYAAIIRVIAGPHMREKWILQEGGQEKFIIGSNPKLKGYLPLTLSEDESIKPNHARIELVRSKRRLLIHAWDLSKGQTEFNGGVTKWKVTPLHDRGTIKLGQSILQVLHGPPPFRK